MNLDAKKFLSAFRSGSLCLHPGDTLPGLTFNPSDASALRKILEFKNRSAEKPILGLVASLSDAQKMWKPLPDRAVQMLEQLWPGPLSVVWYASDSAPASLVSKSNEIGLRVPSFSDSVAWFHEVLNELGGTLPTTSVNSSGEACATTWEQAVSLVKDASVFVPDNGVAAYDTESTVVRIKQGNEQASYEILRVGAVPTIQIEKAWNQ